MKVQELSTSLRQLDSTKLDRPPVQPGTVRAREDESVHGDKLELTISTKHVADSLIDSIKSSLSESEVSAERAAEIRNRVLAGYYARPEALAQTADSIRHFHS